MSTTLTQERHRVAELLRTALPDVPVYPSPPNALTAPCVILSLRDCEQTGAGLWSQRLRVLVVGPGGDNEAGIQALETLLMICAQTLSQDLAQPAGWSAPGTVTSGNTSYLAADIDISIDVPNRRAV